MADGSSDGFTPVKPRKGRRVPVAIGKDRVQAIVAIDQENYVKDNIHVTEALMAINQELPKHPEEFAEVVRTIKEWPVLARLYMELGKSSCTEWEWALSRLCVLFGEEPANESKYPSLRKIGRELRQAVANDFEKLKAYQPVITSTRGGCLNLPEGTPLETVHVICAVDERPLRGEPLRERQALFEADLRSLSEKGVLKEREVAAYLKEAGDWQAVRNSGGHGRQEAGTEQDRLKLAARVKELGPTDAPGFRQKLVDSLMNLLPLAEAVTDQIDEYWILRAALQECVRREIQRIWHRSEDGVSALCSHVGVKADTLIAEMAGQFDTKKLIIVSNDADFFQLWNHPSFCMQLDLNGQRRNGAFYGLDTADYGLAFAFRCALIGKQKGASLVGNVISEVSERDLEGAVPTEVTREGVWRLVPQQRGSLPTAARAFVQEAVRQKVWRRSLEDILGWLNQFVENHPAVRCRFLAQVLEHNIVGSNLPTPCGAGASLFLHVNGREYVRAYEDYPEDTLVWDVDGTIHQDFLDHLCI